MYHLASQLAPQPDAQTLWRVEADQQGKIIKSAVASIHFDPRGGDRFMVLFADNTIAQYHLFAEDPTEAALAVITSMPRPWATIWEVAEVEEEVSAAHDKIEREEKEKEERNGMSVNGHGAQIMERRTSQGIDRRGSVGLEKPLTDRRPYLDRLVEWKNDEWSVPAAEREKKGETVKYPWAGRNPLSVGRLGEGTPITGESGAWLPGKPLAVMLQCVVTPSARLAWPHGAHQHMLTFSHGVLSRRALAGHRHKGWPSTTS